MTPGVRLDVPSSFDPSPEEPERLTLLPAREALRRARPLPSAEEMAIEDLTDDEWKAFEAALKDR